jgi:hypothetical protein
MILFSVCQNSLNTKLILGVIIHIKCWQSNKDDGNDSEDERWTEVGQDCVHEKLWYCGVEPLTFGTRNLVAVAMTQPCLLSMSQACSNAVK